jgi:hypothetical protein
MNLAKIANRTNKSVNYFRNQQGILIIGNGFDRDLGRDITFEEFYESELCPKNSGCPLCAFLNDAHKSEFWYDLEKALSRYVDVNLDIDRDINKDYEFYMKVIEGFEEYATSKSITTLEDIRQTHGRQCQKVPLAYLVFETILLHPLYHIFSFNYTDIQGLAEVVYENNRIEKQKRIALSDKMEYIHGSLGNKDIIIGAKDSQTAPGLELMRKTNRLRNTKIVDRLKTANQVVFFGHSLSEVDRCYFDAFFENIKNGISTCRSVIIITRNEESELAIKNNLRKFYEIDWRYPQIEYFTTEDYQKQVRMDKQLPILEKIDCLSLIE